MILRLALLTIIVALAAPLASATVGPDALSAESLAIDDATITEGDAGAATATFTVTLSGISSDTVTVDYATADGTAVAPGDYSAEGGTLTFLPGETTQTVTVDVNGDALDEEDETYTVELSNATFATIEDGTGLGTITDDDPPVAISVDDVSVLEGNFGLVSATFTVSLSLASGQTVSVDYATANGTAMAPVDYLAATGTLTFAAGQTTKQVTVLVNGDLLDEANETYFINLTNPANATIADGQGLGTITNDDGQPSLSVNDVTVTEGDSGTTSATFTVTLAPASGQNVSVDYSTADGTATAPADYAATSGTLTFAPGQTTRTATVQVVGDTLDELDETFTVDLSNAINAAIADGTALGTILDDDPLPALSINDVTVTEPDAGTTSATFTVSLNAPSAHAISVDYGTADGTAMAPPDYAAGSGSLTFAAGETSKQLTVLVNGDLLDEANETYFVNLSNPSNATIGDGQGVGTITDDDPLPSLSINDVSIAEGNTGTVAATYTVTLNAVSSRSVTVDYATANGSAVAPADYQAATGALTFTPGQTTRQLTVLVNGDQLDEIDENYFVNLSNPSNATIADGQGVGTITDDDALPAISVNDVTVIEGDTGNENARFSVTLDAASGRTVSVDYATADGTAQAPGDYQARTGTLTFAPGETSKMVNVQVKGDVIDESNETYFFNLSSPTNATILDGQGIGTIVDDDGLPSLSINDVTTGEGQSGTIPANFTVTLSSPSEQTVSVGFATADGSAHAPDDYVTTGGNVVFSPGQITKTVTVQVRGDLLDEIDETYIVNLSGPVNATIDDGQGLGTITDDDAPPALSVNDVAITEGNTGDRDANFTVSLNVPSGRAVSVDFATANGTAQAPGDYQAGSGTVTFSAGQTTRPVTVVVNGDLLSEANETYFLNLTNPVNGTIQDGQGLGTITDDDGQSSLSIDDVTVTEGTTGSVDATFTVTLAPTSGQTVTVDYATANGTATAGSDYQARSGTLTFDPGESTIRVETLAVPVFGESFFEGDETFFVNLTNPVNATIADGEGLGTIMNDDAPPPPPPPPLPPPPTPPPPPPPPAAQRGALYQPPAAARLTQPPLLVWRSMKKARFYNVQLYRKGRKILSLWPARARLKLQKRWRYNGRTFRLTRGSYTWLVWPAYGTRKKPNFGSKLGQSTFKIVARR